MEDMSWVRWLSCRMQSTQIRVFSLLQNAMDIMGMGTFVFFIVFHAINVSIGVRVISITHSIAIIHTIAIAIAHINRIVTIIAIAIIITVTITISSNNATIFDHQQR